MVLTKKQLSMKILAIAVAVATAVAFMPMFGTFSYADSTYTVTSPKSIPDQVWTGSAPDLMSVDELAHITVNETLSLDRGTDFTVATDNTDVGTATAKFTGIGNYEGKTFEDMSFQIVDPEATHDYTVTVDTTKFVYDGTALNEAKVKDATTVLDNGKTRVTDYTVVITGSAKNAGDTAEVELKIDTQSIYKETVTIAKADLSKLPEGTKVTAEIDEDEAVYTGEPVEPAVSNVKVGSESLAAADYTVAYSNNVKATTSENQAIATITAAAACKNYTGSAEVPFDIAKAEVDGSAIGLKVAETKTVKYNGDVQTPAINVTAYWTDSVTAKEIPAADYEVAYVDPDSKDVGEYKVTVQATENSNIKFTGTMKEVGAYAITEASIKDDVTIEQIAEIPAGTYASEIAGYFRVMLGEVALVAGTDYTVDATDAEKVGQEYSVKFTGKGNFKDEATKTFTAGSRLINSKYASDEYFEYTGDAWRPTAATLGYLEPIGLKDDETPVELRSDEYTVKSWSNNTNASWRDSETEYSCATATIEGKGEYEGREATVEFWISKKDVNDYTAKVTGVQSGVHYVGEVIDGATATLTKTDEPSINLSAKDCIVTITEIDENYVTEVSVENTPHGNYEFELTDDTVKVPADVASLNDATVTGEIPAGMVTSAYSDPDVLKEFITVKIAGKEIGKNYTLDPSDITLPSPIAVGSKITVKLTQSDNIAGTKTAELPIVQRNLSELEDAIWPAETDFEYNGEANECGVYLDPDELDYYNVNTEAFTKDTAFTVAYANNVDAGEATMTVTGKGDYKGSVTRTFEIDKTDADFDIVAADSVDKQFAVGAPKDQKEGLSLKAKGTSKCKFDASDYEITLAKKPVLANSTDINDAKAEVAATDKVSENPGIAILYDVKIKKDSKNYNEATFSSMSAYTLIPRTVKNADITIQNSEIAFGTYVNESSLGTVTVKVDGAELASSDYEYVVKGNTSEVTSTLTENKPYVEVTFAENYTGIAKKDFAIVEADVNIDQVKLIAPTKAQSVYNPAKTVADYVTVSDIGDKPVPAAAYTVEFTKDGEAVKRTDPISVGTYTATVKTTANYGSLAGDTVTFTITPKQLTENTFNDLAADITAGTTQYLNQATAAPVLSGPNADQFEVVEYDKTWDGNSATKGNAKIALKEGANYTYDGTADKTFTWAPGSFNLFSGSPEEFYEIADQTYTGKAIEPGLAVKATSDFSLDWAEVKYYENNINAAEKTAKAYVSVNIPTTETKYRGSFEGWVVFTIKPAQIADQTITVAKATYAGKAVTPKVTIKDADGALLTLDKDYKVAYSNNKKAGKGTVTVTGIKNYTGETDVQFTINKGTQKITKITPAKKTYKANKKTGKLAAKKTFTLKATATPKKGGGKVTFKKANKVGKTLIKVSKTGKVTVKTGLAKGTYKVKVKATKAANANYKKATKTVTVQIIVK